jgi:anti-sigma factor RsiW
VTHTPKTAALEAYAASLLSEGSTLHLEKHLASCDICQRELASIRAYDALREEVRASKPDAVDWNRMELSLAREARAQAKATKAKASRPMWIAGATGFLAAAAAGLIWMQSQAAHPIATSPTPPTATPVQLADTQPPAMREPMRGVVALRVGSASRDGAEIQVGAALQGGTLETGTASQLHAQLLPSTESAEPVGMLALAASSSLALVAPETNESEANVLRLTRGRATVESFHGESRIVVLADSHRIVIEAARCTIELSDGALSIAAGPEGSVIVDETPITASPDGARTWSTPGAAAIAPDTFLASLEGPLLTLSRDAIVRFEVDGVAIEGGPNLAMHVTAENHHVRAFDANGRLYEADVLVGADGASLTPEELAPHRVRIEGFLTPEEITPVVRGSQRALQHCYEQALRLQPELGGARVVARVTLDAEGAVHRIRLDNENVPASVEACINQEAAQWHFPPPGGPMSFELPLRFATTSGR